MTITRTSVTEIHDGPLAGLKVEELYSSRLNGLKAVRVSHHKIDGFEARALVASTVTVEEVLREVSQAVKVAI